MVDFPAVMTRWPGCPILASEPHRYRIRVQTVQTSSLELFGIHAIPCHSNGKMKRSVAQQKITHSPFLVISQTYWYVWEWGIPPKWRFTGETYVMIHHQILPYHIFKETLSKLIIIFHVWWKFPWNTNDYIIPYNGWLSWFIIPITIWYF